MKDTFYISRSFVDFGPFRKSEIEDFIKRGILVPDDYIRLELTTDWMSIAEWTAPPKPAPAAKPKAKAKTAAKKKKTAA